MDRFTYKDKNGNYQLDDEYVEQLGIDINGLADITDYIGEKDLEEQLECPLEVRCNVVCDSYIYDKNGVKYKVVYIYKDHFDCEDPFDNDMGYTKLCAFSWSDYKNDWFLREDKSE